MDRVSAHAISVRANELGYKQADLGDGHVLVHIPAGTSAMGSERGLDDERPVHDVELDDYWIGVYPVTVGQLAASVDDTGYETDAERGQGSWQWTGEVPGPDDEGDPWRPMQDGAWNNIYFDQGDDHPVGSVSWNDAQAFCAWLSARLELPVVLPTEAQWEKAAHGVDGRIYPWGKEPPSEREIQANLADRSFVSKYGPNTRRPDDSIDDGFVETSPVDAFPSGRSPYGVYDLAGNLGEWVYDIHDRDYYEGSPARNPTGPERPAGVPDGDIDRVNRGGSWIDWAGVDSSGVVRPEGGHSIRAAARTGDEQNSSDDHMGLRVAIDGLREAEAGPVVSASIFAAPSAASQKPDLSGVEILTQHVAGNVYMLEATGDVAGNIGVSVGPDGILIVDDQWAELADQVAAALAALPVSESPAERPNRGLRFIVNTHHHDDHSDGNAALSHGHGVHATETAPEADEADQAERAVALIPIIAHDNARPRMLHKAPEHWPVITFNARLSLYFNGEEIRALAMPGGHTDNDVVVFFTGSNVVHLGDLLDSGISSFPVTDLDAGGSALRILSNIETLLPLIPDDAKLIAGHGPLADKAELHRLRDKLDETITTVRDARDKGTSLEEIQEAGLPAKYDDWGYGYMSAEGWIEMIYRSLGAGDA